MHDDVRQQIEQLVHTLANKKGISRVEIKWGPPDFTVGHSPGIQPAGLDLHPLTITVGKIRETVIFTEEELDDGYGPHIEQKVTMLLDKIKPAKRKIGF